MKNNNSIIIQLKYSPGLFKEFCLFGEKLRSNGYNTYYIVSKKYKWMFVSAKINEKYVKYISDSHNLGTMIIDFVKIGFLNFKILKKLFNDIKPQFILFYGAHPTNFLIIKLADQLFPKTKKGIFVHEPYKVKKNLFGLFEKLRFYSLEFLQGLSFRYANYVILPSPYALRLFKIRYNRYKKDIHYSPLIIPHKSIVSNSKTYFSMVGNIFRDGRLRTFLKIIDFSIKNEYDYKFQIISSSPICKELLKLKIVKQNYLRVIYKPKLTDNEIYRCVKSSKAVLMLHTQGSQSGVLPVSYMNGTPIIARDIPALSQFVEHKKTGYIVNNNSKISEWIHGLEFITKNLKTLSENSFEYYNNYLHENNWERYYEWIFNN